MVDEYRDGNPAPSYWDALSPVDLWPGSPEQAAFSDLLDELESRGLSREDAGTLDRVVSELEIARDEMISRVGMLAGARMGHRWATGREVSLTESEWQDVAREAKRSIENDLARRGIAAER